MYDTIQVNVYLEVYSGLICDLICPEHTHSYLSYPESTYHVWAYAADRHVPCGRRSLYWNIPGKLYGIDSTYREMRKTASSNGV